MPAFAVCLRALHLGVSYHGLHDIGTGVKQLFSPRGPSAVAGLVVAVIIDAVKLKAWWTVSHISVKVLERLAPSIAYRNTSSSVVLPIRPIGVCAALDHVVPGVV